MSCVFFLFVFLPPSVSGTETFYFLEAGLFFVYFYFYFLPRCHVSSRPFYHTIFYFFNLLFIFILFCFKCQLRNFQNFFYCLPLILAAPFLSFSKQLFFASISFSVLTLKLFFFLSLLFFIYLKQFFFPKLSAASFSFLTLISFCF